MGTILRFYNSPQKRTQFVEKSSISVKTFCEVWRLGVWLGWRLSSSEHPAQSDKTKNQTQSETNLQQQQHQPVTATPQNPAPTNQPVTQAAIQTPLNPKP